MPQRSHAPVPMKAAHSAASRMASPPLGRNIARFPFPFTAHRIVRIRNETRISLFRFTGGELTQYFCGLFRAPRRCAGAPPPAPPPPRPAAPPPPPPPPHPPPPPG